MHEPFSVGIHDHLRRAARDVLGSTRALQILRSPPAAALAAAAAAAAATAAEGTCDTWPISPGIER